jgi:predicted RNA-binding Zn-ribbon protein involved in translation (DUF1610 family)
MARARRVTIKCTECGEKLSVLADRLGQERPCPKCGVMFELDEESNRSTYDLGAGLAKPDDAPNIAAAWDEDDFASEPAEESSSRSTPDTPILKRGAHRESKRLGSRPDSGGNNFLKNPMLIVVGLIVCILLGLCVHFLTGSGDDAPTPPPAADAPDQGQVSDRNRGT